MSEYTDTLRRKAREIEKKRVAVTERLQADNEELTKLNAAIQGIAALLRLEGGNFGDWQTQAATSTVAAASVNPGPVKLADVLKESLFSERRTYDVGELVVAAERRGVDFKGKNPWKAVNFTLMGIKAGKKIERVEGNRWRSVG